MAKQRMAGEKVAEEMSKTDPNFAARERRANDPEQLAALMGKVDRDKYDFEGYDDKQIAMAFQGDSFADEDYARLTGKSMGGGDSKPDPTPDEGAVTTPTAPGSITVDNSTQGPGAGIADLINVIKALPKPTDEGTTPSGRGTFNISQVQNFDRNYGDNENTIGDNFTSYGRVNQGNQDTSFNFGYQRAF